MPTWLLYVLMAGICWGTYVPLIAFGGQTLGKGLEVNQKIAARYAAFLCVGVAYFVVAVVFPIARAYSTNSPIPSKPVGISFASLAGVAGALGALGVIFATASAAPGDRIYIAPLIFTLAPVLNTVVSLFWHPTPEAWWTFHGPENPPNWKLYLGVVLAGAGAGLVLYSKEESEKKPAPKVESSEPAAS